MGGIWSSGASETENESVNASGSESSPAEGSPGVLGWLWKDRRPWVRLEGARTQRAGGTFCVVVEGRDEARVAGAVPEAPPGLVLLSDDAGAVPERGTWVRRLVYRATAVGAYAVRVRDGGSAVAGAPLCVTVEPGALCLARSSCVPASGVEPAVGHICRRAAAVRYVFAARDEFGNAVPCDAATAARFSLRASTDLVILDAEPRGGTGVLLTLQPLEEGQAEVTLLCDGVPVLPAPVAILTVPPALADEVAAQCGGGGNSSSSDGDDSSGSSGSGAGMSVSGVRAALVARRADTPGAADVDGGGETVYVSVTPCKVSVVRYRLAIFARTVMCWPLSRALALTVVDRAEDRPLAVDAQRAYLDIAAVGVGRARLALPKLAALRVAAAACATLNARFVGGSLEHRAAVLRARLARLTARVPRAALTVRRAHAVADAAAHFAACRDAAHLLARTAVTFAGEDGIDCGGLSKELMALLQRALFAPGAGLWAPAATATRLPGANSNSSSRGTPHNEDDNDDNDEAAVAEDGTAPLLPCAWPESALCRTTGLTHEALYELCGVVLARTLALCVAGADGAAPLPYRIAGAVFKYVQALPLSHHDLARDDPDYYHSKVRQVLDHDCTGLELTFAEDLFTRDGRYVRSVCIDPASPAYYALDKHAHRSSSSRDRAQDGQDEEGREVTEANKEQYVDELAKYRLQGAMAGPLRAFRAGFVRVLDDELVSLFTPDELVLLCCASPRIDPADMRAHAAVEGADSAAARRAVAWLWDALQTFCDTERRMFLLFVTGSLAPPQGGFAHLRPRLTVRCAPAMTPNDLPRAHTCFNRLDLPLYTSQGQLFAKLLMAVNEGSEYNGIQ